MKDKRDYESMSDEELDEALGLTELFDELRKMPEETIKIVNLPRLQEASQAIHTIVKAAKESTDATLTHVGFDELTGTTLVLEVSAEMLIFDNMKAFSKAIAVADTMEITPVSSGRFMVSFTFDDVSRIVGSKE